LVVKSISSIKSFFASIYVAVAYLFMQIWEINLICRQAPQFKKGDPNPYLSLNVDASELIFVMPYDQMLLQREIEKP
jgi:hypothetical protein